MSDQEGIRRAIEASKNAYAPYSKHPVGAWLVAEDGTGYSGCNVENAAFPAGICAERGALAHAISAGARRFRTVYIATPKGGSPCGVCRQMLYEFSPTMRVVCVDFDGRVHIDTTLEALLPFGFGGAQLPDV
jgi:cytidine deaminase